MKLYPTVCSVCGGPGVGRPFLFNPVHSNPGVCRYYLDQRAIQIAKKEKEQKQKEQKKLFFHNLFNKLFRRM